ncbi:MAG: serine/threonine-protein kinase [Myxococcota bacterium]
MSNTVRFGRYVLERRLAIGGMAEVFLGRIEGPEGFEKKVVIKRILPHLQQDSNHVEMFLDEARLAARFNHPNLIQVYELARIDDQYCLAMEYIDGKDVAAILDESLRLKRSIPYPIVATIVAHAAEGLHYVHELRTDDGDPLNVVHRDISPANIIVTWSGGVKIVDFGIAKHEIATSQTVAGTLKGKFSYMSPEQARGESVDRRSDIFSLGTIFYELLTVSPCFVGGNQIEILDNVTSVRYRAPRDIRNDLPLELEDILNRMLTAKRDDRFPSAAELHSELQQYLADTGIPSASDVGKFLSWLFGHPSTRIPGRVPTAIQDFDEIPVTDEFSSPSMMADEQSYRAIADSQSMPLHGLHGMDKQRSAEHLESDTGIDDSRSDSGIEPFDVPSELVRKPGRVRRRSTLSRIADRLTERRYWPTTLAIIAVSLTLASGAIVMMYRASVGLPWNPAEVLPELFGSAGGGTGDYDVVDTGSLEILSEPPGARVLVDGTLQKGRTPLTVDNLTVGTSHLVVAEMEGRKTTSQEVAVDAEMLTTVRLVLPRGVAGKGEAIVEVFSDPGGAAIAVDKESIGETTPATLTLTAGKEVIISVTLKGYTATPITVLPEEGKRQDVEIPLEEVRVSTGLGYLELTSSPNTDVLIGGKKIGSTPLRRYQLPAGPVVVQLRHPRMNLSKTLKLTIPDNGILTKRVVFRKGQVLFDVRPWAEVYLGRKKLGTTPMPPVSLYEGTYAFKLVNSELGVEKIVQVSVRPGKPRRVIERMR